MTYRKAFLHLGSFDNRLEEICGPVHAVGLRGCKER